MLNYIKQLKNLFFSRIIKRPNRALKLAMQDVLDKKMKEHSTKINAKMNEFLKSVKDFEQDVRKTAVDEIRERQSELPEGFEEYLEQKKLKDNAQENLNSEELLK